MFRIALTDADGEFAYHRTYTTVEEATADLDGAREAHPDARKAVVQELVDNGDGTSTWRDAKKGR